MFDLFYRMWAPLWKGPSPRVGWEHGSVETADVCKEFKRLYIAWVFPPTVVYPVNWEGGTVPWKTAAWQQRRNALSTMLVRREGEQGLPRRAAVFTDFCSSFLSSFFHASHEGGSFWGGHPQSSRDQDPWSVAAQGPPEGILPFLSLRITEAQMTDRNEDPIKGLSVLALGF